ncbi:MAG TPA: response regulator transcription factor [Terriglobia bacterium]|nr:response regulator transcription factor [Terriglobia bacterium]
MKRTTVLLADDHQMFLDGLSHFLAREFDVVALTRDGSTMLEMARQHHPDVLVLDISMPHLSGIEAVRALRSESIPAKILFLSMYADLGLVEEAFRIGASGYVLKSGNMDELVKAIQCISRGGTYVTPLLGDVVSTLLTAGPHSNSRTTLTSRQRDVLRLLTEGRTMKQIGEFLHISTRTTESHKYEIMRNLGLKTTAELIRYAVRNKLV